MIIKSTSKKYYPCFNVLKYLFPILTEYYEYIVKYLSYEDDN